MEGKFKKYRSYVDVRACEVTMGEAYAAELLHAGVEVSAEAEDRLGYAVLCEDGFRSWFPKDVFEARYRCVNTYVDRVRADKDVLDSQLGSAVWWLDSDLCKEVSSAAERALLELQVELMWQCSKVLDARLALETTGKCDFGSWGFGAAVSWLEKGYVVRRGVWPEGRVVIRQVPSTIEGSVIPGMWSLPASAKSLLLSGGNGVSYRHQLLICDCVTGVADSWSPSAEDVFAQDWGLVLSGNEKPAEGVAE